MPNLALLCAASGSQAVPICNSWARRPARFGNTNSPTLGGNPALTSRPTASCAVIGSFISRPSSSTVQGNDSVSFEDVEQDAAVIVAVSTVDAGHWEAQLLGS